MTVGGTHGERKVRAYYRGLRAEPQLGGAPSGVQGQSPWWGSGEKPPFLVAENIVACGRHMETAK